MIDENEQKKDTPSFTSIEEAKAYYVIEGYETAENTDAPTSDELTMQRYAEECIQRVSINFKGEKVELIEENIPITTIAGYIKYFEAFNYKLINSSDTQASLRMYSAEDYGEIKVKAIGSKVFVTKIINGKVVLN